MAIGSAAQKGNVVYVYDEKGWDLFTRLGELHGYTGATVTIKAGGLLYTLDERGQQLSVRIA